MKLKLLIVLTLIGCSQLFAQPVSMIAPNLNSSCNTTIDVPIKVQGFQRLLSLQGSLGWDVSKMQFQSVVSYGPANLSMSAANFGTSNISSGKLSFSWNDADLSGETLTDLTVVFTVRFSVLGISGNTPIQFINTPTTFEAINTSFVSLPFQNLSGSVGITCIPSTTPLTVILPTITPTCNSVIDVPVKVKDFANILSVQGSLNWNSSVMQFQSISNYGPASFGMGSSNFGTNNASNGVLTFSWTDLDLSGESLTDSTILFSVRFQLIGPNNSNPNLQFSNSPTTFEVINSSFNTIPTNFVNGSITSSCNQSSNFEFITPALNIACSSSVDIPVKVRNFRNILSCQGSIVWDTAKLRFQSIAGFGPAQLALSSSNFGVNATSSGKITFSWTDADLSSETLADSTTLFILRYTTTGANGATASLAFSNTPTPFEVINSSFNSIQFNLVNGPVRFSCGNATTVNASVCSNQLPYVWNGSSYTASGTYSWTGRTTTGLDSLVILNLTVKNTSTSSVTRTACSNQLPYVWNGSNYSVSGTYTWRGVNAVGCDSIVTLSLIIKNISSSTVNASVCSNQLPYTWNGNSYSISGAYTWRGVNAASCDSIVTLNLTIKNTTSSTVNVSKCSNQLPYTWNGNTYSVSGTYTWRGVNAAGCDSTVTLNLSVKNTTTSTVNAAVCSNQLPYLWNGNTYSVAGTYTWRGVNAAGCDSTVTLNLSVKNTSTSTVNASVCSNQLPYLWNGNSYSVSGTYNWRGLNAAGCDSTVTLNLFVKNTSTSTVNASACSNQLPYTWNGNSYSVAGTYTWRGLNAAGCDSTVTLNLLIKNTSTSAVSVTKCSNQLPYLWNGNSYSIAGAYTWRGVNSVGCDSTVTLNLSVKNTSTSTVNAAICSNQLPYQWNGNSYNVSGTYTWVGVNAIGCDSIVTLNLGIRNTSFSFENRTVCSNELPYQWHGTNYNSAGTYSWTGVNASGCDSLVILNLTLNYSTHNVETRSTCTNYTWNGSTYSTSGTYTYSYTNGVGCLSVDTLKLTITNNLPVTITASSCTSYNWNGTTYSSSGTYTYVYPISSGCSKTDTLKLTINQPTTSFRTISSCISYLWNGVTYSSSGTKSFTTTNAAGCDSTAVLNLIINNPNSSTVNAAVCSNQLPYTWNGNTYSVAGTYTWRGVNAAGCDSVVILNLSTKSTSSSSESISICSNQLPYVWNGNSYSVSGTYTWRGVNTSGCDSIVTLSFLVRSTSSSSENASVCSNQLPYLWHGNSYTVSGIYTWTGLNSLGCDSIVTLNLIVKNISSFSQNASICAAQLPYVWHGNNYTVSGTYNWTGVNAVGCDSIVTLNLLIKIPTSSTVNASACSNQLPYLWNGITYSVAGTYTWRGLNAAGCDSVVTLNLSINNPTSSNVNASTCANQLPYLWNGNSYSVAGIYTWRGVNAAGCDSVVTLNLSINNPSSSSVNDTLCSNLLPYVWNGNSYNASGTYTWTGINAVGCDSVVILNLFLKQASNSILNVDTISNIYQWHGNTYSNSGTYTWSGTNAIGCDSIVILNLTLRSATTNFIYPNPTEDGLVTINWANAGIKIGSQVQIRVYDRIGRLVSNRSEIVPSDIENGVDLKIKAYANGMYILSIRTINDNFKYSTKLIKQGKK